MLKIPTSAWTTWLNRRRARPASRPTAGAPPAAPLLSPGQSDPYLDLRREWNERFGANIQQAHQWRAIAITCGLLALLAVSTVVYLGARNKIVPYIVEVDKDGAVAAINRADRSLPVDSEVIQEDLVRFVSDWRDITQDVEAKRSAILRIYALLPGDSPARAKLNEYFRNNNPIAAASAHTVDVAVTRVARMSAHAWQVEWQEVTRDRRRGDTESTVSMKVSISVDIQPPTTEAALRSNPLGVHITDLNWSQQF